MLNQRKDRKLTSRSMLFGQEDKFIQLNMFNSTEKLMKIYGVKKQTIEDWRMVVGVRECIPGITPKALDAFNQFLYGKR